MKIELKQKLSDLGFEVTETGTVSLSGPAQKVYETWIKILTENFKKSLSKSYSNPPTIDQQTLKDSKYSSHFPHQLLTVTSHNKKFLNHCTPASCLHLYAQFKNRDVPEISRFIMKGTCARYENGEWNTPFRLPFFTMFEYIVIGSENKVIKAQKNVLKSVKNLFETYNIQFVENFATDAFFLEEDRGAAIIQKLKGLKKEFVGEIENSPVALASLNYHEDYFGKNFSITHNKEPIFSMCMAFGIERLTAFSLLTWGKNDWPIIFKI